MAPDQLGIDVIEWRIQGGGGLRGFIFFAYVNIAYVNM